MKFIFKSIAVICFTTIAILGQTSCSVAQVQAPDPTNFVQNITINIDGLGNAKWEATTRMNQAQWEAFKAGPLVNDPSITKRNMERSMSAYVIEDFNREVDDMNRTMKITLTIKAAAQYDGNGNWEYRLGSKNPEVTKLADNAYMATSNMVSGSSLIQQIYKIYFPKGASNIQQQTDPFGNAMFTYSAGRGMLSYLSWNNILGAILIIAAAFLFLKPRRQQLNLLLHDDRIAKSPSSPQ
jgi:hypothetical protein